MNFEGDKWQVVTGARIGSRPDRVVVGLKPGSLYLKKSIDEYLGIPDRIDLFTCGDQWIAVKGEARKLSRKNTSGGTNRIVSSGALKASLNLKRTTQYSFEFATDDDGNPIVIFTPVEERDNG